MKVDPHSSNLRCPSVHCPDTHHNEATVWMNLGDSILSERSNTGEATHCMLLFTKMPRKGKSIEIEIRLVVAGAGERGRWERLLRGYEVSFWSEILSWS